MTDQLKALRHQRSIIGHRPSVIGHRQKPRNEAIGRDRREGGR
jgi:hypothetical protein